MRKNEVKEKNRVDGQELEDIFCRKWSSAETKIGSNGLPRGQGRPESRARSQNSEGEYWPRISAGAGLKLALINFRVQFVK